MNNNYLIGVDELFGILGDPDLVILDTWDAIAYNKNHIPNAIHLDEIFTYISPYEKESYEGLINTFVDLLSVIGITREKHVIVYEDAMDNGYGRSCRGIFILEFLGVKNCQILHGGIRAWSRRGFPLNQQIRLLTPSFFAPNLDYSIIVTTNQMVQAINDSSIKILDVRDHAEWVGATSSPYGVDYCPRKGRIPQAIWIEWYNFMTIHDGIPWFKDQEAILELCKLNGIFPPDNIYLYCFKGARASNTYIALKIAGFTNVRNYFASWNDWSRNFSLPIETENDE